MEKEFIPYEQALALKELGFDEPCFGYYLCKNSAFGIYLEITCDWIDLLPYDSSSCKAPTFQQAFRWFREKYKLVSYIRENEKNNFGYEWVIEGDDFGGETESRKGWTYEEAELACLIKLIEIVKTK